MKEFMIKHPFITFLIAEDICIMITNIAYAFTKSDTRKETLGTGSIRIISQAVKEAKEQIKKADDEESKVEFGFH